MFERIRASAATRVAASRAIARDPEWRMGHHEVPIEPLELVEQHVGIAFRECVLLRSDQRDQEEPPAGQCAWRMRDSARVPERSGVEVERSPESVSLEVGAVPESDAMT